MDAWERLYRDEQEALAFLLHEEFRGENTMPLQTAVDIIHAIREDFPHIAPFLTASGQQPRRDGSTNYIIGVYQGSPLTSKRHWVLSSAWDWEEFTWLFAIFTNK